jgi:hypothetical protein
MPADAPINENPFTPTAFLFSLLFPSHVKNAAGFTKRSESEYDAFGAGHSSTSISAGLGMAVGRDAKGKKNNVIAIIGDGAITGGMAYEAMNHAGFLDKNMVVILNDNQQVRSHPVVHDLCESCVIDQPCMCGRCIEWYTTKSLSLVRFWRRYRMHTRITSWKVQMLQHRAHALSYRVPRKQNK